MALRIWENSRNIYWRIIIGLYLGNFEVSINRRISDGGLGVRWGNHLKLVGGKIPH